MRRAAWRWWKRSRRRRLEAWQRRRGEHGRPLGSGDSAAHRHAAHRGQQLAPRQFEAFAESFVDPVGGKAARGFQRHDARQGAIFGETDGLQPMVEGARAQIAAQPFGHARPKRRGIGIHRFHACFVVTPVPALHHNPCPRYAPTAARSPRSPPHADPGAHAGAQASCPGRAARSFPNHVDVAAAGEGQRRLFLGRGRRVDQGCGA